MADNACAHAWDIEQANGPTSPGTCRKCGERRDFLNSCDEILENAVRGRPMDFRAPHKRVEVLPMAKTDMAKTDMKKRHTEIERRWPEIKKTIEETGSLNQAAKKMGYSYDAVRNACKAHGFDMAPYCSGQGRGRKAAQKPAEVDRKVDATAPSPAIDLSHLGQPLIGLGLIILGAWLEERKSK